MHNGHIGLMFENEQLKKQVEDQQMRIALLERLLKLERKRMRFVSCFSRRVDVAFPLIGVASLDLGGEP